MSAPTQPRSAAVRAARAEASAWITRLHGPNRTAEMEAGLRRWLAERPENAQEFEGLTEVWDLVAGNRVARAVPRLERWEHSAEAMELQSLRRQQSSLRARTPRFWAYAALLPLICGLAALGMYRYWAAPLYATNIGEQRIMQLPDGTRVSLNSDSRLLVAYSAVERRLELKRGEVFFEVAKDSSRPFVVAAGDQRITALGTSFVVRRDESHTAVTLIDGKIAVQDSAVQVEQPRELSPGQRVTFASSTRPTVDTPRIEALTAWRRGEVMLNDTPLMEAVAEMNRYDATAIAIDDPSIADLVVSGLYHTGDSEGFARSVAAMYGLKVWESEGRIHLRK